MITNNFNLLIFGNGIHLEIYNSLTKNLSKKIKNVSELIEIFFKKLLEQNSNAKKENKLGVFSLLGLEFIIVEINS